VTKPPPDDRRRSIAAVTFDYWNTLVAENPAATPQRIDRWHDVLTAAGRQISRSQVAAGVAALSADAADRWHRGEATSPAQAVERFLGFVGVSATPTTTFGELVAVIEAGMEPAEMRPADGIGAALEALHAAGLRLGIICDVGITPSATLRGYLDHHGLLAAFDHWSFSDEVGAFKPDRRIFDHARSGLGLATSTALAHVGDLRRTDIAGAQAMGWLAVRYRGIYDDDPAGAPEHADGWLGNVPRTVEGDVVIEAHAELAARLLGELPTPS
jgi:FMN phosphatase YigB (HAD superfamily)